MNRLEAAARHSARTAHNGILGLVGPAISPRAITRRVAVLGTGRSGTTALMEAVAAGTRGAAVFEPFRPGAGLQPRALLPAHEYPRLRPGEGSPALRRYVRRVFDGRALTRWSSAYLDLGGLRATSTVVVKEVRLCRSVGWLEELVPGLQIAYVVRHPLDVIASMLRASHGWSTWSRDQVVGPAAAALGVAPAELVPRDDRPEHWLAALWIADTRLALTELHPRHAVLTYEELAAGPESQLRRLLRQEDDIDAALCALSRPNRMAGISFGGPGAPYDWSEGLAADVMAMVSAAGIRGYVAGRSCPVEPVQIVD